MAEREEICRRHGIAERFAPDLVGETAEELEADAAARAAIAAMVRPASLPAVEEAQDVAEGALQVAEDPELPPRNKAFDEYSEDEWAATHRYYEQSRERKASLEQVREKRGDEDHAVRLLDLNRRKGQAIVDALHPSTEDDQ